MTKEQVLERLEVIIEDYKIQVKETYSPEYQKELEKDLLALEEMVNLLE